MPWIESHQSLAHHPKTLRLAASLKCGVPAAIGYVHLLWYWALDYAPDGHIREDMRDQVAKTCEWRGKSARFWDALVQAGFVERADGGVRIHDWREYAGRLIERRRKDAERKRGLIPAEVVQNSNGHPPELRGTSGVPYQPDLNQPDRTVPDPYPQPPPEPTGGGAPAMAPNDETNGSTTTTACCPQFEMSGGKMHYVKCPNATPRQAAS